MNNTMPKDYQEVERIVEEFGRFTIMDGNRVLLNGQAEEAEDWLRTTLTTYGNARELQGVEKVEGGVPREIREDGYTGWDEAFMHNTCRQATLDHITKVKSELT